MLSLSVSPFGLLHKPFAAAALGRTPASVAAGSAQSSLKERHARGIEERAARHELLVLAVGHVMVRSAIRYSPGPLPSLKPATTCLQRVPIATHRTSCCIRDARSFSSTAQPSLAEGFGGQARAAKSTRSGPSSRSWHNLRAAFVGCGGGLGGRWSESPLPTNPATPVAKSCKPLAGRYAPPIENLR
jgi:hypothetical protein